MRVIDILEASLLGCSSHPGDPGDPPEPSSSDAVGVFGSSLGETHVLKS